MGTTRNTRQRQAIINALYEAEGPLSVAQIHERAKGEIHKLGIATVYRVVRALRQEGDIEVVELPGEEPRYESAGRGHHHHFRCRACERTFDLGICPLGMPEGTMLPGGYTVEDHNLTLYGRCESCVE